MYSSSRFQIYAYYLLSIVVISIFAFRSGSAYLDYAKHFVILLISAPYAIAGIVRTRLEPVVMARTPPLSRAGAQLSLDLSLFTIVSFTLLVFNIFIFEISTFLSVKSFFWAMIIGYFASIDSSLYRVRNSHADENDTRPIGEVSSVSQKLNLFLSTTVLMITVATAISAYGYINAPDVASAKIESVRQDFIVEVLFILGIVISLSTRVIFSYSVNLQTMFETQITTLKKVHSGELTQYVPVLTRDEFGSIAHHTNQIINQLREKEKIQRTLEKVVSRDVMEKLLDDSNSKNLKTGQEFELAILFCDLRRFTSYAENKPPDEVIVFLNAFFTKLADVVAEHNGIVNKFIGDAILAVFGVDGGERYVEDAVEAAWDILMHSSSAVMRDGSKFEIGIGINWGRAVAGTIGSSERFEYTFIGDAVNTASRLDGLSKRLNYRIISSSDVYDRLPDHHKELFTDLGEHQIRGKSQPVHIYGAVSDAETDIDSKIIHINTFGKNS